MAKALLVFVAMCMVDVCWAWYIQAAAEKRPFKAALWSGLLFLGGSFVIIQYTDDHRVLWAAIAGSMVGTYIGVRRGV